MQTDAPSPLVAERQRLTWSAIHEAAAEMTLEHGLDAVTVAQIAARAGVSPRTFFNYFDSKEDAIVGVRAPHLSDEALAALAASEGELPLLRIGRLLTDVASSTIGPDVDMQRRRLLSATHPSLRTRLTQVFTDSRKFVIAALVEDAPTVWNGAAGLPSDPMEARALIMIGGALVTFAWTSDPDRILTRRDDALEDAISTFRKVATTAL